VGAPPREPTSSETRGAERPAPPEREPVAPPPPPSSVAGPSGLERALDLLGVSRTASREDIERAYRQKSLACHPDKVAHLDPDLQHLASEKFKRLHDAYRLLLE
jgi:DnaJ-domain-containing protein 1